MGIRAKLFIHPDKSMYEKEGKSVTGIKFCWGLSVGAKDFQDMSDKMLEGARVFQQIKGELGGRVIEVEEDETEVAAEMTGEFYPEAREEAATDPEAAIVPEIEALLEANGLNKAQRAVAISRNKGNLAEYLAELKSPATPKVANGNGKTQATPAPARQVMTEEEMYDWMGK